MDELELRVATERVVDQQFHSELLDAVGQAVIATDPAGVVLYWNKAAEQTYGWSASEAVGRGIIEVVVAETTREQALEIMDAVGQGVAWSGEYPVGRRDGSRFPAYVTLTPVLGPAQEVVALIGVSTDMSELEAGKQARRHLCAVVNGSGDAIYSFSLDGTVTSWNGAAEQLYGFSADEMIGQPIFVLAPPDRTTELDALRARLAAGGSPERLETTRYRRDGTLVAVLLTASAIADERGHIIGLSVIARDIGPSHRLQRLLETAEAVARLGSYELDVGTGKLIWSQELFRIAGIDDSTEPTVNHFMDMVHPDDLSAATRALEDGVQRGLPVDILLRINRPDGEQRWVRSRAMPELAADGKVVKLTGFLMDETERVEGDRVRQAAQTSFEISFEQATVGAVIADLEGYPTRVNPAYCLLLGRPADSLVGRKWTDSYHPAEVPLRHALMEALAAGGDTYEDERRYLRPDGSLVWGRCQAVLVRDEVGAAQYFFIQVQDITERKLAQQELGHQVAHDFLTGLPNRTLLADRLQYGLAGGRRRGSQLGVLFIDIDHLKTVNDTFGHAFGDGLLRHAADKIAGTIRPGDTVARFSGDEFVVVCDDVDALEAEQIAARVLEALARPSIIDGRAITVSASIGVALADEAATAESVVRDADAAMYRAKERGRGRVELFDEALREKAAHRVATTLELRLALERDEFSVHYQPIVDLATDAVVSAEALLRWNHPERGMVSPLDFIPLAEETGLIVPIGAWVLEQACHQLMAWQRTDPGMAIAVNLSVRQMMDPAIVETIAGVLRRTGVRPETLCLELTESVVMDDVEYFGRTLTALKGLGVTLSIDDFGTGYSSLSYLKRFPLDAVKVDRAFVDGLGSDPHDTGLVAAIVAMATALGLGVVAEGVETADQLAHLKGLRCQRAQGFYIARPMPAEAMVKFVADHRRELACQRRRC